MDVITVKRIAGAVLFRPAPHVDERGFFSRTFDAAVMRAAGIDPAAFIQDSVPLGARRAPRLAPAQWTRGSQAGALFLWRGLRRHR